MKKIILYLSIIIASPPIIIVSGYILYLHLNYYRINDDIELDIVNQQDNIVQTDKIYSLATYNIGFGAYDKEFSFFMDKGKMKDGTQVEGKYGKAINKENVIKNITNGISKLAEYNLDFCFFQEVDISANRSYFTDEKEIISDYFKNYASTYASNFHSAYLCYPLHDPHGSVEAGLYSLYRYKIESAIRKQLPIDESFFTKFFDLDRCFVVTKLRVNNGHFLVLINCHFSAYDKGGSIRKQQLELLCKTLQEEYNNGNYVIVGGDFNHALCETQTIFPSQQQIPEWIANFDSSVLPKHFSLVCANNNTKVATCRSADCSYIQGVNYTATVDGFIISDNITATANNLDFGFLYSDHNPVKLEFRLQK